MGFSSNRTLTHQLQTLDDLSLAVHYNRWIFNMMLPHLGDRVLEVGCGIGNMTEQLAKGRRVLATDIQNNYLKQARQKLGKHKNIQFRQMNFEKPISITKSFKPNTIVCVNVLEHIQGDVRFLTECFRMLPPGGKLLIFVPALQFLFGSMDAQYGHFRRYSKSELESKMKESGFMIPGVRYLNLLGIFGWWWNGKILKKSIVPLGQILIYDQIIRWVAHFEKWLPKPIGLSLFCAGEKVGISNNPIGKP